MISCELEYDSMTPNNIIPIILAGGKGTRLRPALTDVPKIVAPVGKRPFVFYLLDQLQEAGFDRVILCTGYMAVTVERVGKEYTGIQIRFSREEMALGTGGALYNALPLIEPEYRYILAMNGDSYVDIDIASYLKWNSGKGVSASMVLAHVDDTSRFGRVEIDRDETVISFKEKQAGQGAGWINAGIYTIERSLLENFRYGKSFSLEEKILSALIQYKLYGYRCKKTFIDIGTPESYRAAETIFSGNV